MKSKFFATSGIIAALYIAVSLLIAPFSFGAIQLRLGEILNHLVVFNKKYFYAIIIGVFITNLFSPNGPIDLVFGVGQTLLSLGLTILSARYIKSIVHRMIFNTVVFTFMMWLIAWELNIVLEAPFGYTWLTVAAGEAIIMAIGIPIMLALNKRINFKKIID
ncbi:membrane protein [Kurthia zopfii]|uniref:Membrane protein n=1 Tax=Kurthia zopfii TaxID=1650 RepID=A0A8B4Q5Q0_9BACL|nr:QueT transporter family protein [Kurthia zopfii]TDR33705.1 putative membrane protein [Kurthia zopfii]GEK32030.1 membrane protein [Kurthia zopfii]STX08599.1 Queuosine precursor ECF transporter S component QueT [Kurthia zopfii]